MAVVSKSDTKASFLFFCLFFLETVQEDESEATLFAHLSRLQPDCLQKMTKDMCIELRRKPVISFLMLLIFGS